MAPTLTATEQRTAVTEAVARRPEKPEGFKSETARKLRERVDTEHPRTLLEELRQRKPVENPKAQHLIERNIAATENSANGTVKRSPDAERRFEEAKKWNNLTQGLIERGIDAISPEQQKLAIEQIKAVLQRIPQAERLWWGLSVEQINEEIRQLLKDPDFIAKVRERRTDATDESQLITIDLAGAQSTLERSLLKKGNAQTELDRDSGELSGITAELERFQDRTAIGGKKGDLFEQLEAINTQMPALQSRLQELQNATGDINSRLAILEDERANFRRKGKDTTETTRAIEEAKQERERSSAEIVGIMTTVGRKEFLEQRKAELLTRRGELEGQQVKLGQNLEEANLEYSEAQATSETVARDRRFAEEEFVAGIKNILRDATNDYLDEKVALNEPTLSIMLDEEAKQTTDKAEKVFFTGIKSRNVARPQRQRVGGIFGIGTREIWVPGKLKTEVIDSDYQKYLETGNPVPLVRAYLETGRDPETGEPLTSDEINTKLADREFIQKFGTRVIEEMLRARLKSGEITENEAQIIVDHEWGAAPI